MPCTVHLVPHVACLHCRVAGGAMRPTVFAELAAAELASGVDSCPRCDYVYAEFAPVCPRCQRPHPRLASRDDDARDLQLPPVTDLGALTLRDL